MMRRALSYRVLAALGLCLALGVTTEVGLAGRPTKTTSDATFVFKASAAGMAEVDAATLAMKQASSAEVKRFAKHMLHDHTKANKELLALANEKKLPVAPSADARHQEELRMLATLKGAAFDRAYMKGQVKDHEEAVALFQNEARNGMDPDLKAWAAKTLPTLKEHLKMAQDVRDQVKGADTGR